MGEQQQKRLSGLVDLLNHISLEVLVNFYISYYLLVVAKIRCSSSCRGQKFHGGLPAALPTDKTKLLLHAFQAAAQRIDLRKHDKVINGQHYKNQ